MGNLTFSLILTLHVIVGVAIIGLVLLQHGKGADMGAAFGGGASGSLFGASGSANFMSRTTAILAAIFFCTSLGLSYLANGQPKSGASVMDGAATVTLPAKVPAKSEPSSDSSKAQAIPK